MDKYEKAAVSSVFCLLFCIQKWTLGGHAMDLRKSQRMVIYNFLSYDGEPDSRKNNVLKILKDLQLGIYLFVSFNFKHIVS